MLKFLDGLGVDYREVRHQAVYSMAGSAHLAACLEGSRCKNLLVQSKKGKDRLLVVTPPDAMVDLGALGRSLGLGRLSFCSPVEMMDLLAVEPGAMSPFALLADRDGRKVRLLMDRSLEPVSRFLFHPLVNTATVSIRREGLARFLVAIDHPAEFVEIPYRVVEHEVVELRANG
ncbi:YbaK/EbsC family protein [Thauera sp. SDU_THAU2]|uniref:YbaK/EbsC family protein n=1 Tax=Thauera sp. SDU_THAU2 TaxID=3136633 RepID=UPI00311DE7C8